MAMGDRMRIGLAVFAAVYWISSAAAQPIAIPFAPPVPLVYDIEETRTRTSSEPNRASGTAQIRATLEFGGAASSSVRAIWTTESVEAGGERIDRNSPGAASMLVGVPIGLRLDASGAPEAIEDWAGLRVRVLQAIEANTPESQRTDEWRRGHEAAANMFASMDDMVAARTFLPEVTILSLCQDTGLVPGEVLRSETLTPSPLGGAPIRTFASYELQSVDRDAGEARILFLSAFDPQSAAASMRESAERIARETGRDAAAVQREFEGFTLTHNARAECVVDLATGVTRSVTYSVEVTSGPQQRQTDQRAIRLRRRS
jgi:hypothetical protein